LTFLYAIYRFYVTGSCVVVTFVLLYCFHRGSVPMALAQWKHSLVVTPKTRGSIFPGPYRERVEVSSLLLHRFLALGVSILKGSRPRSHHGYIRASTGALPLWHSLIKNIRSL